MTLRYAQAQTELRLRESLLERAADDATLALWKRLDGHAKEQLIFEFLRGDVDRRGVE